MAAGPPPSQSSRLSQCKFSSSPMIEFQELAAEIEYAAQRQQRLLRKMAKEG